jgi:hypothetical protein
MNTLSNLLVGDRATLMPTAARTTHTYVVGQPGIGKSCALESWALQDILAGHGVAVIDPHGDLYRHLVEYLADKPKVRERVILIDPCDKRWTVSFNPLEAMKGLPQERLALFLTDIVVKIWKLEVGSAPRMIWLLTNSFLALSDLGLTLLDLPRFLMDASFRERLLPRLKNDAARSFFAYEFPQSPSAVHQWVTPVLNKIGGLIFDPDLRLMVAGHSTLNFRDVLDRKLVLLIHLPKGILGEGPSALMAAFLVAHLQKAALSRANTRERAPYYLYLDEFQNYTTDNINDILSESRKYGLSLTLAHQYLDQLPADMRSAVLSTTGTLCSFRVGYHDASHLAKEIFPASDFLRPTSPEFALHSVGNFPELIAREHHDPSNWDRLAHLLTNLPPRQFWVKRRGVLRPAKLRTLDVPERVLVPDLRTRIREFKDASGALYGQEKIRLQKELEKEQTETRENSQNVPLWGD